jgi:hypothetical protein
VRRAAPGAVIAVIAGIAVILPSFAAAEPWAVAAEAGAELDSNVQRVETGPGLDTDEIKAWVMRFGARVERKGKAAGGLFAFNVSDLTRVVANDDAAVENVSVLAGNVRWLRQLGERPALAGFGLMAIDAFPLSDDIGARTFRNLGADAMLAMRSEDEHELTLGFGVRDFTYKPDHDFDWRGPAANARL